MKRGKPYQSALKPYTQEIMELRDAKTPYHKIVVYLKTKYGIEVSHNAVWSFVTRRSNMKRIIKRAQSLNIAPVVDVESLRSKLRSQPEPKPQANKWTFPEL